MFRKIAITTLAAATFLTAPVPALAMPRGSGLPVVENPAVQLVDHRRFRRKQFRRYRYRDYGYRNHGYRYKRHRYYRGYRHRHDGAAIVAGIIGLGAALAIASANRRYAYDDDPYYDYGYAPAYGYQPGSAEWIAACARKYRSFDPRTGLYTAYSGVKRRCRLP